MGQYIEFDLENGGTILVEDTGQASSVEMEFQRASPDLAKLTRKAKMKFEEALRGKIRPAAQAILAELKDLSPNEVSVQFGVKLNAETGAILAKAGGEVSFNVTLSWKK